MTTILTLYDRKVQNLKYSLLRLQTLEKPIWRYDRLATVVQSPVDTYPLFAYMAYIGGFVQFRPWSRLVSEYPKVENRG